MSVSVNVSDFPFPALVLAGGLGTRLSPEVPDVPKAMAPVAGRPFAEWLVAALVERGARDIVFCTGHRHEAIERHFGGGERFGARIRYSREAAPLGTAGALRLAAVSASAASAAAPPSSFLLVNGDSLCAFDLERLARTHAERRALATLWTVPVPPDEPSRYGTVETDAGGRVVRFAEKSPATSPGARVHAGIALLQRSVLLAIPPDRPVSLETEVLPALVADAAGGGVWSVPGDGPLLDIGTPASYRSADRALAALRRRRFVLLDRDGTLIVERNYLSDPAEVELTQGAGEALSRLAGRGLGLVVVTNQSAVGRGLFDAERLGEIHAALEAKLAREAGGVVLDGIYSCPHRPDEGCACRKPRTELVERAAAELSFDPAQAFVVGDKASDIELGKNVGAATILVRTGYGREVEASGEIAPDHVADDLRGAADWIERSLGAPPGNTAGRQA